MTRKLDFDDTTRCPLCGAPNECAVAAGRDPNSCWCMTATMHPASIAAIPAEAQGRVCICAACAREAPASS